MSEAHRSPSPGPLGAGALPPRVSRYIDWYAEGEGRVVEVDGVQVLVRFVGRKGRRGRIAITAPAGAVFRSTTVRDMTESI